MQWLSDLIKHLTISKPLAGASFITSGVLIFGRKFFPNAIDGVPSQWNWLVIVVFIFSLSLFVIWYVPSFLAQSFHWMRKLEIFTRPTQSESRFLQFMAKQGDNTVHLSDVHRRNPATSMLDLLDTSAKLIWKGYIEEVNYDETRVKLTLKGRKYVLKHFRESAA